MAKTPQRGGAGRPS